MRAARARSVFAPDTVVDYLTGPRVWALVTSSCGPDGFGDAPGLSVGSDEQVSRIARVLEEVVQRA